MTSSLLDPGVSWYAQPQARRWSCAPAPVGVPGFHTAWPQYAPTPLMEVPALAAELGVGRVFVKDESTRLGLTAFKALGVSYAIYRIVSELAGAPVVPATVDGLRACLAELGAIQLVTATDGNHGRAVARIARLLGIAADIYVPWTVDERTVQAIESEGVSVTVLQTDYDQAVRHAAIAAESCDSALMVQDTSWPGYEQVPQWIVDGYSTLFHELDAQLRAAGAADPAVVTVPIGVGSLAQAAVTHYRGRLAGASTALLGVEPDSAACVLHSLVTGSARSVATGVTIMAGLNCGTPSEIAWPYLSAGLDAVVALSDDEAARAVADLNRHGLSSGPCGAAGLGALRMTLTRDFEDRRRALQVGDDSTAVLISTEAALFV